MCGLPNNPLTDYADPFEILSFGIGLGLTVLSLTKGDLADIDILNKARGVQKLGEFIFYLLSRRRYNTTLALQN